MEESRRREYLEQLRRVLPECQPWEEWLARTGELPPDFEALPACPDLPDPLLDAEGRPILDAPGWSPRRDELTALFHRWILGTVPPPPDDPRAETMSEREEAGAIVREVRLAFGPGGRATLRLELLIPRGDGPFPVFVTQQNHRSWALIALRRGYMGCVYAGADVSDDTDTFLDAYPGYDWSRITRRAWAASRCVDYLVGLPQVDAERIALTGHSRNGKLSVIAAALDWRFSAVISSSSGAGGVMPFRCFSEQHGGESIEMLTRVFPDWFHPRLRFFSGREDRLPIDMHELVALIAPRPCLLSIALNDGVESTWAMQQTYAEAMKVYRMLGAESSLRILWRPGGHETWPAILDRYLDWCDLQFDGPPFPFPERLIHPMIRGSAVPIETAAPALPPASDLAGCAARREAVRERVRAMLGDEPPEVENPDGGYGEEPEPIAMLLGRHGTPEGIEKEQIVFGEYLNGDLYLPAGLRQIGKPAPAVLWMPPFSYSHGYGLAYRRGEPFHHALARAGFVVFCFDPIGQGRRIEEIEGFHTRHPGWSLLGKMVRDARAALTALAARPYVDAGRIRGVGYSLGAMVGLHLGALDDRWTGFASVCGPAPFRLDTPEKGGIRLWGALHCLLPGLAGHADRPEMVPYDVDDLMACMAPKPLLVVSPRLDREARVEDVTQAVEGARRAYDIHGAGDALTHLCPEGYNRFGPESQGRVIEWLQRGE